MKCIAPGINSSSSSSFSGIIKGLFTDASSASSLQAVAASQSVRCNLLTKIRMAANYSSPEFIVVICK